MAWAERQEVRVVLPLERLEQKEKYWGPSPITERDRWVNDYASSGCELFGEYEIDEDLTLLRFMWSGSAESLVEAQVNRYHNVVLSKKMRPYKPFDVTFGSKK